ncbi:sensor domain-containing diguanylate cyclase [Pseudomonas sp. Marseille-Q8238]
MTTWWCWLLKPAVLPLARMFVVLVCLSLVTTDAWLIWKAREVRLHGAEVETSNLAAALARQATDSLKKADTILIDMVERLQNDAATPAHLQRLQPLLQRHVHELAELHGLFVYGPNGEWRVSSFGTVPADANNADREYFIFHREHPDDYGPHVGLPVRSRTTGEWVIPVSRRLQDEQGGFAGVALATISIDYFQRFYASFDIRSHGSITLALNNGLIVVRSPYVERAIGSSLASGVIFSELLPKSPTGTAVLPSIIDGTLRLYSYRQIQGYPLVVIAALGKDDILADWRRDAIAQFLVVLLLALILGLFGFYLIHLIKRGQKTEAELLATRDALRAFNQRLEKQALEDELTRLANRRRFARALEDEFSRAARYQRPLSLILFDVDYFKQYNDIYGHSAGDECLRAVAEAIRSGQKRSADLAARYGGEEFCLLLPETDAEGALQVAEQVRAAVEALAIPHTGCPWNTLSVSAGVRTCSPGQCAATAQGLVEEADKALYAAKAAGRNRVVLYAAGAPVAG